VLRFAVPEFTRTAAAGLLGALGEYDAAGVVVGFHYNIGAFS
jgi:hypothetical protein